MRGASIEQSLAKPVKPPDSVGGAFNFAKLRLSIFLGGGPMT